MITLFAAIAGFISSIVPEIIKYFKDINDKKHELQILAKQVEYSKILKNQQLDAISAAYDHASQMMLYGTYNTNVKWVDALNGSVRPVLAYSFFLLYMLVKYFQYKAITQSAHIIQYIEIIWNVDDQAIFAGIISFYYGQRTFKRALGGK